MAVVPRDKTKGPPRPTPTSRDRKEARRLNEVLNEKDLVLFHDHVRGDNRVELRWVVSTPDEGSPPVGQWACLLLLGLQTTRTFGSPRRPYPKTLSVKPSPKEALVASLGSVPGLRLIRHETMTAHLRQALVREQEMLMLRPVRPVPRVPRVVRAPGEPLLPAKFRRRLQDTLPPLPTSDGIVP